MKYNPISRRFFLQGAGAAFALPFLPSMMPKGYAAGPVLPRYIQITLPFSPYASAQDRFGNALPRDQWNVIYPNVDYATLTKQQDHLYYKTLASIAANSEGGLSNIIGKIFDDYNLRSKMNLIAGLDVLGEAGHNRCGGTTASSANIAGRDGAFGESYNPNFSWSIDRVIEKELNDTALRFAPAPLFGYAGMEYFSFSWETANGQPLSIPHQTNLDAIYQARFQGKVPGGGGAPAQNLTELRKKRGLSSVLEDYKRLMANPRLGSEDKKRVDYVTTLLSEVEKSIDGQRQDVLTGCFDPKSGFTYTRSDNESHYRDFNKLTAAMLACGLTRTVGMLIPDYSSKRSRDIRGELHSAPHGIDGKPNSDGVAWHHWQYSRAAEMINELNKYTESNGMTILDNSLVYLVSGSVGNNHQINDLPVITAGSAGGKIQTGYLMDCLTEGSNKNERRSGNCTSTGRPIQNLLTSIMSTMGLTEAQWNKYHPQGSGFGEYVKGRKTGHDRFLANRNSMLPFFLKGYNGV